MIPESCVEAGVLRSSAYDTVALSWQGRLRQAIATIQEGLVERDTEVSIAHCC